MDSRPETYKHIQTVQGLMLRVISLLMARSHAHDQSKLVSPEVEAFDEFTPKLRATTYGSEEYKTLLAAMKPALDHHYAANDHHPEYHSPPIDLYADELTVYRDAIEYGPAGPEFTHAVSVMDEKIASMRSPVRGMGLLQLLEMLCDWKAATLRHHDGDIRKSIEINQKRFGYSDELKSILLNTLADLDSPGGVKAGT